MRNPTEIVLAIAVLLLPVALIYADEPSTEELNRRGVELLQKGEPQEAIQVFEKILAMDPGNHAAAYNIACAHALAGRADEALDWLAKAVKLGFDDYFWAKQDPDLASIRNDPRFEEALAPLAPQPAPEFTLPDLNGNPVSLSDFRGKVVLLDFWGTWCGWCVKAIPDLKESYAAYKDLGFTIIGITYEYGDPDAAKAKLARFVKDKGMDWPILIGDEATKQAFGGIRGFPTSILITADGKIYTRVVGYREHEFFDAMIRRMLELREVPSAGQPDGESLARGQELVASDNPSSRWRGAEALASSGSVEALPHLIGLLEDPVPWIREGAVDILGKLTAQDFGYAHNGPEEERGAAVARWKEWYERNKDRLVYVPEEKQFLVMH